MIFTDDLVDMLIGALIEERFQSSVAEEGVINYTDFRATLKRMYPRLVKYFDDFFIRGLTIKEMKEEHGTNAEMQINKLRGFAVMYLYKKIAKEEKNGRSNKVNV